MATGSNEYRKEWLDAYTKFNYFITGLTAAILSFSLQFFQLERSIVPFILWASWVYLGVSLLLGLWLLEAKVALLGAEVRFLQMTEYREQFVRFRHQLTIHGDRAIVIQPGTGEHTSSAAYQLELQKLLSDANAAVRATQDQREKWTLRIDRVYTFRNYFFIAAIGCLILHRLVNP